MENRLYSIDSYRKDKGKYINYKEYLIHFRCEACRYKWDIDESDIDKTFEVDDLVYFEDLISDSISTCPLCGSVEINKL